MKLKEFVLKTNEKLQNLRDIPLLAIRLVLAYGFFEPAKNKWSNMESIASWFESMNYPFPALNAYLAGATEALGVILLFFGLFTRIISVPLIIVMIVAIATMHWGNGFAASDNGYEIPLYYIIMLFTLFVYGPGRISIDAIIRISMKK